MDKHRVEGTSTTRLSRGSSRMFTEKVATDQSGEDALHSFFEYELSSYFANKNDSALFIKAVVADGLVSYLMLR